MNLIFSKCLFLLEPNWQLFPQCRNLHSSRPFSTQSAENICGATRLFMLSTWCYTRKYSRDNIYGTTWTQVIIFWWFEKHFKFWHLNAYHKSLLLFLCMHFSKIWDVNFQLHFICNVNVGIDSIVPAKFIQLVQMRYFWCVKENAHLTLYCEKHEYNGQTPSIIASSLSPVIWLRQADVGVTALALWPRELVILSSVTTSAGVLWSEICAELWGGTDGVEITWQLLCHWVPKLLQASSAAEVQFSHFYCFLILILKQIHFS